MSDKEKPILLPQEVERYLAMIEAADRQYIEEYNKALLNGSVDALALWERLAVFCIISHELRGYNEDSTSSLLMMIEQKMSLHRSELDEHQDAALTENV